MKDYRVTWSCQISGTTSEVAARAALAALRDPALYAHIVLETEDEDGNRRQHTLSVGEEG
jgi:hypothetical protein